MTVPCPACAARVAELEALTLALAERCGRQSELLSRAAEKAASERARCARIARRLGAYNVALVIEAGEG